jgi:hypothetical protein
MAMDRRERQKKGFRGRESGREGGRVRVDGRRVERGRKEVEKRWISPSRARAKPPTRTDRVTHLNCPLITLYHTQH